MFDLDRLAAFDRGLAARPAVIAGTARNRAASSRPEAPHDLVRAGGARAGVRCSMSERLGVEPLCPFARIETA